MLGQQGDLLLQQLVLDGGLQVRLQVCLQVRLHAIDGLAISDDDQLALGATTATATATPSATTPTASLPFGRGLTLGALLGQLDDGAALVQLVELDLVRGSAGQTLAGQHDDVATRDGCAKVDRRDGGDGRARGRGPSAPLAALATITALASAAITAATSGTRVGLLVGHLGHGQVVLGGDPAATPLAPLDTRQLGDVREHVGHVDEVGAGIAPEAHHLDTHAQLLDGADGGREVTVAGDHDRDVDVLRHAHQVDHELDVQVRLDPSVAVLADVLAHDLVAGATQEGVELPLVLVLGIETRVGIGAHEVAARGGCLEERDIVDVDARGLCRIEDVRHVHEDGDVLAHAGLLCAAVAVRHASRRPHESAGAGIHSVRMR